jgi:hypothetical protein
LLRAWKGRPCWRSNRTRSRGRRWGVFWSQVDTFRRMVWVATFWPRLFDTSIQAAEVGPISEYAWLLWYQSIMWFN